MASEEIMVKGVKKNQMNILDGEYAWIKQY